MTRGWTTAGGWRRIAALALALAPAAAIGDRVPDVEMATPGMDGGAVRRFTMRFSEAIVPLGDPRAPAPVEVACPVAGEGRWIAPGEWTYEFARPLPGGLSCSFTVREGLKSARGTAVGGQQRFTVDTGGPAARTILPSSDGDDIEEDQVFLVATNTPAERASVAANAYCAVDGIGEKIAVDLLPGDVPERILTGLGSDRYEASNFLDEGGMPTPLPASAADRGRALAGVVALRCRRPLPPGRDMALVWSGAIRNAAGRSAGRDQRFDYHVRDAYAARFECSRVNPQAGCSPVEPAHVRFTAQTPLAMAKQARLVFSDGRSIAPKLDDVHSASVDSLDFPAPLPEASAAKLVLPDNLRDESGRLLANAGRFPLEVRFDAAPPLVKFAATFGILEEREGGVLPVTVRNVEPALAGRIDGVRGEALRMDASDGAVAAWLRRLKAAEEDKFVERGSGAKKVTVNLTGAKPLLAGRTGGKPLSLALPGKGKDFEVTGIPLKGPGFYVVELASPRLGRALLGRDAPRYVATGALVTNMTVHFKWGRGASLAWVTALDSGKPVAGASVRVTDSCDGRTLATGTSDASGRAIVAGGLPEPQTYAGCDQDAHALMVSARKDGDFSFVLTDWGEGIRPFDFDLPYGWSAPDDILHTVLDRSLVRAGETVSMKHILRRPAPRGFAYAPGVTGTLRLVHRGSDTVFELPLRIGADGIGENSWSVPKDAPQGDYGIEVQVPATKTTPERTLTSDQSIRVDEYRLPSMRASVTGPRATPVRPARIPVDLYAGYLGGGGASRLPVQLRAAFEANDDAPPGWEDWTFGGKAVREGVEALDGNGEETVPPTPPTQTMPATLDASGAARSVIAVPAGLDGASVMTVEMDYADPNGEVLTASARVPILPSAVRVGVKTDGWLMRQDDMRLKLVALDAAGRPIRGRRVEVALYSREILSARRRLIGGFYAYDNQARTTRLRQSCAVTTDEHGVADCAIDPGVSGEVYAVATARDDAGNLSRAVQSVWLAGDDEWWFGGDNGDRMDIVPERKAYRAGETARLQVRMPFRAATALVTVEREGVLASFVTSLSGTDPVVEVPLSGAYAPDVYVSVLAVRGRVAGWRLWLAQLARDWHLPFFSQDGARPTALVDLAKPSYRLGVAKLQVGWEAHRLAVAVRTDRSRYHVRDVARTVVQVLGPDGKPPRSAEIAFAAVDEALLQLAPNESWKLLDAMMGDRPLSVLTSTAQTQVVGKRHYGRKALAAGGGGGGDLSALTRADFRPVLLWKGRVPLDAHGRAWLDVPLSDALSSFRMVAVATAGPELFGSGATSVRTTQDLTLYPGVPPLVREGDDYAATFTLRNGSDRALRVTATAEVFPHIGTAPPQTVTIPPGGAAPVSWHLPAPTGIASLRWTVTARSTDGRAVDSVQAVQQVVPLWPVETWAATLVRVGEGTGIPIAPPAGAIPGRGGVEVALSASLAPPLAGVWAYMTDYPYNCLEQRLSRAVALGDAALWSGIAGDLPAYLDGDGLVRYFPSDALPGSDVLTAYVLTMTAEAGLALPADARARMIAALQGVVDGRLRRDDIMGSGDARLRRLAALAALARNGAADPAMVASIGLAPQDMPTAALTDWIAVLDHVALPDGPVRRAAAEAVLRRRLTYEGSRLDLSDGDDAPWWMMSSGDEYALRALVAVLGRPGWQDDAPRMMVGAALRQRHGHWDTTPANAWGAIAARRFAAVYQPAAVSGTTNAALGPVHLSRSWPQPAGAPPLRLPLTRGSLLLAQSGGAGPWAAVSVRAAVPLTAPLAAGYRVTKQVSFALRRNPGRMTRGDVLHVRITVEGAADRNWVVISDPIPAGATVVGDLGGQSTLLAASGDDASVTPSYVERRQDGFRAYFAWAPKGRFTVDYAVRLNGAGRFRLPPTRVEALYSPDVRGLLPNAAVNVAAR